MVELGILSASAVAGKLGVHVETVYDYCRKGKFPNAVRGEGRTGKWSIPTADVIAYNTAPPGLTMKEASDIIGLSTGRLSEACRAKQMRARRWRGKWIVKRADLQDYDMWRKTRHGLDYDILHNRAALWQCYVDNGHSFRRAAAACRCSNTVFRMYFYEAGLEKLDRTTKKAVRKSLRGSGVPDVCPRNCPSWLDCIVEGSVCYYDPEQVPLNTMTETQRRKETDGEWLSVESARSESPETGQRSSSSMTGTRTM